MKKLKVVRRFYGMKYTWKGCKDRNRHKNRVKRSWQAWLVYVKNVNRNIPTTWRWACGDHKTFQTSCHLMKYFHFLMTLSSQNHPFKLCMNRDTSYSYWFRSVFLFPLLPHFSSWIHLQDGYVWWYFFWPTGTYGITIFDQQVHIMVWPFLTNRYTWYYYFWPTGTHGITIFDRQLPTCQQTC